MNKELIKKYKTEFDHWLNGGKVISKYTLIPTWSNCQSEDIWRIPDKNISKVLIVINDEYATYRKALAEGKTIQYINSNGEIKSLDEWDNIGWKQFKGCVENYRIKPEEPKFKVGDWVVNKTSKQRIIKKVASIPYGDSVTVGDTEVGINVMLINDLELWKPKKGEYCWFWNKGTTITVLELLEIVDDGNRKYFAAMPNIPHSLGGYYQYCEPFLGKLPTKLQEALC